MKHILPERYIRPIILVGYLARLSRPPNHPPIPIPPTPARTFRTKTTLLTPPNLHQNTRLEALSPLYLSIFPSISLSIYLSIYLSIFSHYSLTLSLYLSIHLYIFVFVSTKMEVIKKLADEWDDDEDDPVDGPGRETLSEEIPRPVEQVDPPPTSGRGFCVHCACCVGM